MKIQSLVTLLVLVIFFAGVGGVVSYFIVLPKLTPPKSVSIVADNSFGWKYPVAMFPNVGDEDQNLIAYSDIRDPGGVPQGLPIRLKIPVIGVDSAIEDAFITPDGRMDVPQGSVNVAWFALGPHPGRVGSAVIGGHFGIDSGVPRVFYDLDKLKAGDKIYIEDDGGETLAFMVRKIELFDRNADATTVFTSNDGLAHLNLITCEGVWNQVNDTYPDRRVVFTDAIPSEGPVVVSVKSTNGTKPTIVAEAPDSTSLERVTTDETTTTPSVKNPLPSPRVLVASAKSLYETPVDGLVTSFLLLSIVFVTFKIIRR